MNICTCSWELVACTIPAGILATSAWRLAASRCVCVCPLSTTLSLPIPCRSDHVFFAADAITGTSRDYVVDWYSQLAQNASADLASVEAMTLSALTTGDGSTQPFVLTGDAPLPTLPVGQSVTVTVFNPLASRRSHPICAPTNNAGLVVTEVVSGDAIVSQITPSLASFRGGDAAMFELCFLGNIPPLGYNSFVITALNHSTVAEEVKLVDVSTPIVMQNGLVKAQFSPVTGSLTVLQDLNTGTTVSVNQSFAQYPEIGNAYEFIPVNNTPTTISADNVSVHVYTGPVSSTVVQVYSGILQHAMVLTNCSDCNFLESRVIVGTLELNTAFINRFESNIDSGDSLYTGVCYIIVLTLCFSCRPNLMWRIFC